MKKIIIFLLFLNVLSLAQERKGKNMWLTKDSCVTAYESGNFLYYYPKYFNNRYKKPIDGIKTKGAPAFRDAVVKMTTANGRRFIILPKNTILRWDTNPDGSLEKPYAHDACGNQIFSFSYLPEQKQEEKKIEKDTIHYIPISMLSQLKIPGPPGKNGRDGKNGKETEVSSNWLLWFGIGVAIVTAVVAIFLPQQHTNTIPVTTQPTGVPPGGNTGPVFSKVFKTFEIKIPLFGN